VISQFKENFFHLESGGESFNEDSSTDGIVRDADERLRKEKHVVPKTRFKIMFHLWKVKVGTGSLFDEFFRIVVEVECKVKEGTRHRRVIDCNTGLVKVPTAGTG
jgi:hypothetical protein